jgi:hypothetical protein
MPDIIDKMAPALDKGEQAALGTAVRARVAPLASPAPATEPEPAPATPATEPEAAPPAERKETVPLTALHEERERRRELQGEVTTLRERAAKMEAVLEAMRKPAAAEPEAIPRYEDDPEGHYRATIAQQTKRLDALEGHTVERITHERRGAEINAFIDDYRASVDAFAVKQPDFPQAYQFLLKTLDAELEARGFGDAAERAQIMEAEEAAMVIRAKQAKKDPAELVFNYAKFRGFAPAARGPDGKFLPKTEAPPAEEADDKLTQLAKGQAAAKTLGGPKGSTEGAMTLSRLADLADEDPAEFDKQWQIAKRKGLLG